MARRHVSKLSQMWIFGLILALLVGGSGPLSAQDAADTSAVSYTHLTLPTNREV